jgi:hypothetical protein
MYPIVQFVVEDIKVKTRTGKVGEARHWNSNFSPLEVGKHWFYRELAQIAPVTLRTDTAELRERFGLEKTSNKTAEVFASHCVDSWALANSLTGGHATPDNIDLLIVAPLRLHRRQLHRLQPEKGGIRKPYGGTRSHGFKRGGLVEHPRFGVTYVGGMLKDRLSLHAITTGKRLTQSAKPADCHFLCFNSWRSFTVRATGLLPRPEGRGIRPGHI